jgi:hypothetical protein
VIDGNYAKFKNSTLRGITPAAQHHLLEEEGLRRGPSWPTSNRTATHE